MREEMQNSKKIGLWFKNQTLNLLFVVGVIMLILVFGFWWLFNKNHAVIFLSPLVTTREVSKEKLLEKYTYENLKKRGGRPSEVKLERILKEETEFTAWLFSYQSEGRKITGLAHLPKTEGKSPVVVMVRGYVEPAEYKTGIGTRPAGEYYAKRGYLTLAPDFLGYGESDMPPTSNIWEERFLRLPAVMDLLASIPNLPVADPARVFLWGHSNGAMIVLSVLELTGKAYPATLWAPMSQYFPYDVLYYTYEAEDGGKSLRKALAEFEKDYDTDAYNYKNYLEWLDTHLQIHQGTADPYIPLNWTETLVNQLKAQGVKVNYYLYPAANHNLQPGWETVVARDLNFFKQF